MIAQVKIVIEAGGYGDADMERRAIADALVEMLAHYREPEPAAATPGVDAIDRMLEQCARRNAAQGWRAGFREARLHLVRKAQGVATKGELATLERADLQPNANKMTGPGRAAQPFDDVAEILAAQADLADLATAEKALAEMRLRKVCLPPADWPEESRRRYEGGVASAFSMGFADALRLGEKLAREKAAEPMATPREAYERGWGDAQAFRRKQLEGLNCFASDVDAAFEEAGKFWKARAERRAKDAAAPPQTLTQAEREKRGMSP